MSWKTVSLAARRLQFVKLAFQAQQSMSRLCRWLRVSRKTGYKWKRRFEKEGLRGLRDRTRRPHLVGELWGCDPGGMRPAKYFRPR